MCPTSSNETVGLLMRRVPLEAATQVEVALTGTGIDVAERPDETGVLQAALSRLRTALEVPVVRMHQVHGNHVHLVRSADEPVPEADALVTTERGVALMARSADCAPILLADVAG